MQSIYEHQLRTIDGDTVPMDTYRGKALLIVNVASRCQFTPQYQGLEAMYQRMRGQDFEILGFPCDQFGNQEPGADAEIKSFCDLTYGVTFPMFSKVEVNGAGTHPLFASLKHAAPGLLGAEDIKWNFTKFLVDRSGRVIKRYAPAFTPDFIERELASAALVH